MELVGDALIQVRIGVAENDPNRTPELFQLGNHLCAGPDHGQQVFVQAEEGGTGTRRDTGRATFRITGVEYPRKVECNDSPPGREVRKQTNRRGLSCPGTRASA